MDFFLLQNQDPASFSLFPRWDSLITASTCRYPLEGTVSTCYNQDSYLRTQPSPPVQITPRESWRIVKWKWHFNIDHRLQVKQINKQTQLMKNNSFAKVTCHGWSVIFHCFAREVMYCINSWENMVRTEWCLMSKGNHVQRAHEIVGPWAVILWCISNNYKAKKSLCPQGKVSWHRNRGSAPLSLKKEAKLTLGIVRSCPD